MFSQFGRIIDVVAMKTYRLRGQAWVVFTDTAAATNALRTMQGFPFFDKPIVSASTVPPPPATPLTPLATEPPCLACCTLHMQILSRQAKGMPYSWTNLPITHTPLDLW